MVMMNRLKNPEFRVQESNLEEKEGKIVGEKRSMHDSFCEICELLGIEVEVEVRC